MKWSNARCCAWARAQKLGPGQPEAEQDRNRPQRPTHYFTAYELRSCDVFCPRFRPLSRIGDFGAAARVAGPA